MKSTRFAVENDPQKLLLPDPDRIEPYLEDQFVPVATAAAAFVAMCLARRNQMRPALSGIQHHVMVTGAGYGVAAFVQDLYVKRNVEKEAIYRHYIELHPEDFPKAEPRKVGDIFKAWTPIR